MGSGAALRSRARAGPRLRSRCPSLSLRAAPPVPRRSRPHAQSELRTRGASGYLPSVGLAVGLRGPGSTGTVAGAGREPVSRAVSRSEQRGECRGAVRGREKKMVFESVVVDVLNRFLGDYVVNLDESQLSLGIWKGNGVAAPGSRETATRFLVASSVLGQPGAATCSCPPRPSSYVKRGGGSRAGGARAVRLGEARAEASRPGGALDLGAGDPWPPLGKGAIPGSFALGCQEGSGEPKASLMRTCKCT